MATYTKLFSEITKDDIFHAGGKGANLGEMTRAGLPVPAGFVLLTSAYRRFIEVHDIQGLIDSEISALTSTEEIKSLEAASGAIRQVFGELPIPDDIRREIIQSYEEIGRGSTAVRSSATAEDLPGTSFAGQYDTYLHVSGIESLMLHIKKCWASLWNSRAIAYRIQHHIEDDIAHGVVVQQMIPSEKSGILFTANPINGRRDHMLLNASWGLGEAIVGGEVTPDQWVIDRNSRTIVNHTAALKDVMTVESKQGITLKKVPKEKQEETSLTREEVLELLRLGEMVENHYRSPQDIEWTWKDGRCCLVQTRPVTSLYPMPRQTAGHDGLRIHINFSVISQGMYQSLTPMGESLFLISMLHPARTFDPSVKDERDIWWYQSIGGRMFIDYTELVRKKKRWKSMVYNDFFSDQDPLAAEALMQVIQQHEGEITAKKDIFTPFMIRKAGKTLSLMLPMVKNTIYGTLFPKKGKIRALQQWNRIVEDAKSQRPLLRTLEDKLTWIEDQVASYLVQGFYILCWIAPAFKNIERVKKLAAPYIEDLSILNSVEKSLPGNSTTEMGVELMEIARKLDREGRVPSADEPEVKAFLSRYGHRCNDEMDIGIPRWSEDPRYVLDLIKSHINQKTYNKGIENFQGGIKEAQQAIEQVSEELAQAGAKRKARKAVKLLNEYRQVFGLREHSKFALIQVYQEVRELLKDIGAELTEEGRLDDPMDVFFLRFHELRQGGHLQDTVRENRQEFSLNRRLKTPRILLSTGECIYGPSETGGSSLRGMPVSAGVGEGTVRVLSSPNQGSQLKAGEILVTKSTNPAWTPLFLRIGGLVMETGGPISHGSVVAREYGVPAVAGISDVTGKLKDGQVVRVNGETGTVEILSQHQ